MIWFSASRFVGWAASAHQRARETDDVGTGCPPYLTTRHAITDITISKLMPPITLVTNQMPSDLNNRSNKLVTLLLVLTAFLVSSCAKPPTVVDSSRRAQIRSVTVVGYDDFGPVSVIPAADAANVQALAGAATGYAGGVFGVFVVQGVSEAIRSQRTKEFERRLGESLPDARNLFSKALADEMSRRGVRLQLLVNRGYQGADDRYLLEKGEATGDVIVEVRFSAHVGHSGKASFPVASANYKVIESSGGTVLARGILVLSDRPNESIMLPIEVVMRPERHHLPGDMDVAYENTGTLRDALNESVQLMARALVNRILP